MDILSLYYFSEAAKDLHFTKTAGRLYITQQTLSNHIKRLEDELGLPLFNRKPCLSLTCAGEHALQFAHKILTERTNIEGVMSDISRNQIGSLRIGASMVRANLFLPSVLADFSELYPKIELFVVDGISSDLEKLVAEGDLDFAIVLEGDPSTPITRHHLLEDHVCCCIPDNLLTEYYGAEAAKLKSLAIQGTKVEDVARLPFCMMSNRLGGLLKDYFEESGNEVNTYLTTTYSYLSIALCSKGHTACFSTQTNLIGQLKDLTDNINIFPVYHDGKPVVQELFLIRQRNRYFAEYARYFMDLTFKFFDELKQRNLYRVV